MASKPESIQQYTAEVVPSSDLPKFAEALTLLDGFEITIDPIAKEARDMKITDRASRERAGVLIAAIKKIDGDGEDTMAPYSKIVNRVRDFINQRKKRVANRVEEVRSILTPKMSAWDRAEEAAAKAEQDRIQREKQAELDRAAEVKRQEDEKAAAELKRQRDAQIRADLAAKEITSREAEKLRKESEKQREELKAKARAEEEEAKKKAAEVASRIEVHPDKPMIAGNVRRVNYSADCTEVQAYILTMILAHEKKDMVKFGRMVDMIEVSNLKLSAKARACIKTSPQDTKHDYTIEEFEALYPFVKVKESRSY
jgi:hypothetical protein